MKFNDELNLT